MGLLTDARRALTRLWGRTEQAVGEAYGNEALEYEGTYDESKVDAEEAAEHDDTDRRHRDDRDERDDGSNPVPVS